METEKVMLFEVYKKNGKINADTTEDMNQIYELFGFLKCFIKDLEEELISQIEKK